MTRKKIFIQLIIAVIGVFATLYGVVCLNSYVLMGIPVLVRMWLVFPLQWLIAFVPLVIAFINKEKLIDFGFSKEKLTRQIIIGIIVGAVLSLMFTVMPIVFGQRENMGQSMYSLWWQFIYDFAYKIFAVALAEEFIFRGFIFKYILKLRNSRWLAIIVSSLLFGLFHIFGGSILQVALTTLIGIMLCIAKEKIKGCTIISLIIAHGVYDALINIILTAV